MLLASAPAFAPAHASEHGDSVVARTLAGSEQEHAYRCNVLARVDVGRLPQERVYWHVDAYSNRAEAEAAKGSQAAAVIPSDHGWLLLSIREAGRRPANGTRVAEIGPLPIRSSEPYTAVYVDSFFIPAMVGAARGQPGPEAWYTLAGVRCGDELQVRSAGQAEYPRRGFVLILHHPSLHGAVIAPAIVHVPAQPDEIGAVARRMLPAGHGPVRAGGAR